MKKILFILIFAFFSKTYALEKVNVGAAPALAYSGLYLAYYFNYFKAEGLDVQIYDLLTTSNTIRNGRLDVAGVITPRVYYGGWNAGAKYKIVADMGHNEKDKNGLQLLVRKDHFPSGRYKTIKDLKGFKIGLQPFSVPHEVALELFLKKAGVERKDVNIIALTDYEIKAALVGKIIDAAVMLEPTATNLINDGLLQSAAKSSEVFPDQAIGFIIYSEAFIARRETATKFMKAYLRGVQDYNDAISGKNQQAANSLKKILNIDTNTFNKMNYIAIDPTGQPSISGLNKDLVRGRIIGRNQFVASGVNEKTVLDLSFLPKNQNDKKKQTK